MTKRVIRDSLTGNYSWFCVECEWPQKSHLPSRFFNDLCCVCDPRSLDERGANRTQMLDEHSSPVAR